MNIFSWVLIPSVVLIYWWGRSLLWKKDYWFAVAAGCLAASFIFVVEFFISWGSTRSVSPFFLDLYFYSWKRETLLPIVFLLLWFWLFRGALWKKNEEITFLPILLYTSIIFYSAGLAENLYNRYDSDFYQIILNPINKLLLVFFTAQMLSVAESLNNRIAALLVALTVPLYGMMLSFSYGCWYSNHKIEILLIFSLMILIVLLSLLFSSEKMGGFAIHKRRFQKNRAN